MEKRVAGIKETEEVFILRKQETFTIRVSFYKELPIVNVFLFFELFSIGK